MILVKEEEMVSKPTRRLPEVFKIFVLSSTSGTKGMAW